MKTKCPKCGREQDVGFFVGPFICDNCGYSPECQGSANVILFLMILLGSCIGLMMLNDIRWM